MEEPCAEEDRRGEDQHHQGQDQEHPGFGPPLVIVLHQVREVHELQWLVVPVLLLSTLEGVPADVGPEESREQALRLVSQNRISEVLVWHKGVPEFGVGRDALHPVGCDDVADADQDG